VSRPATRQPTGLRRVERWIVGVVMAVIAFAIEKVVLRSIKRGGGAPKEPPPEPFATSKGSEVSGG